MKSFTERIKHRYNLADRNSFVFCYVLLGLSLIPFLLFWVYVNINSFVLAFTDMRGGFTPEHFAEVWKGLVDKDRYGWNLGSLLGRSVLIWLIGELISFPAMLTTYVLYKKIPGHYVFRVIFMIPTILAGIVWTMMMRYIFTVGGPILAIAEKLGIDIPLDVATNGMFGSPKTAFVTMLVIYFLPRLIGFNMIISGAYARIPEQLFEVGQLEGLGFIREFFVVAVPLVWPTIVIGVIQAMATVFTGDCGVFLYTMGQYDTATMGFYIYYLTYAISGVADTMSVDYGYAAAIGVSVTCITIPLVLVAKYGLEKLVPEVSF